MITESSFPVCNLFILHFISDLFESVKKRTPQTHKPTIDPHKARKKRKEKTKLKQSHTDVSPYEIEMTIERIDQSKWMAF